MVSKEDDYDEKVLAIRFSFTNEKVLRLSDVTKSLTMSSRVVGIALEQARQRAGACAITGGATLTTSEGNR